MKAVAHTFACSHLPLSGHMDRMKALPPSSMKTFLPPSRHSQRITLRITRRSMKTLVAVDNNNRVSPLASYEEYVEYLEKEPKLPPVSLQNIWSSWKRSWKRSLSSLLCLLSEVFNPPSPNSDSDFRNYDFNLVDIEEIRRVGRILSAGIFRSQYTYGNVKDGCNSSKEQKTCIWPGATLSWQDESSGIMWVGVYGRDSICVVARNEDPDETRLRGILKQFQKRSVLFQFMESIIVEIEDLAGQSSKICERFHTRIKKPFGVVSVIPDAYKSHKGSGHEASSIEYGETKAIEFLQEKVKNRRLFTVTGTIQTAIAAFEQLFQKKFKADEIKVSVVDPFYFNFGNIGINATIQSLTICQINEHLAVINKPGSKDSRTLWEQYYASALSCHQDFN